VTREAWGHHASCSCPIGADGDPLAVLDSRFRVRGVNGLRVVDASVFPRIPGIFIVTNIYMVSEKAADVIADDHRQPGG
jgi:choline dehydrogenase